MPSEIMHTSLACMLEYSTAQAWLKQTTQKVISISLIQTNLFQNSLWRAEAHHYRSGSES